MRIKHRLEEMVKSIRLKFSIRSYRNDIDDERQRELYQAIDEAHRAIEVLRSTLVRMYGDRKSDN